MKLNLEDIKKHKDFQDSINKTPLSEIELYENGKKIDLDPRSIADWKYVGLSNLYFFEEYFNMRSELSDHG